MEMKIRNKILNLEKNAYIMGILNITPDSFFDGGKYMNISEALSKTEEMIKDGADIIDIGGESTRPQYTKISVQEEIERIVPVIDAVRKEFDIPISVDTYKAAVAKEALLHGTDIVNDIWGLRGYLANDSVFSQARYDMAAAVAKSDAAVVIMHNRKLPFSNAKEKRMSEIIEDINDSLSIAWNEGISKDRLIIDPGIGFAKTTEDNLFVMNRLNELAELGYPLMLATSNKSMIGNVLNVPVTERVYGTVTTTVYGYMKGARIFRVHDIKPNRQALDMVVAISEYNEV